MFWFDMSLNRNGRPRAVNKVLGSFEGNAHLFKVFVPDGTVTAGFNNKFSGFDADAWDAQYLGIRCAIDINWEVFRVAKCPGEFGVNVKLKVRRWSINNFMGGKVVKTHKPVCLVETVFTALGC